MALTNSSCSLVMFGSNTVGSLNSQKRMLPSKCTCTTECLLTDQKKANVITLIIKDLIFYLMSLKTRHYLQNDGNLLLSGMYQFRIPSLLLVQKLEISNGTVSHKARKNDSLFSFFTAMVHVVQERLLPWLITPFVDQGWHTMHMLEV